MRLDRRRDLVFGVLAADCIPAWLCVRGLLERLDFVGVRLGLLALGCGVSCLFLSCSESSSESESSSIVGCNGADSWFSLVLDR